MRFLRHISRPFASGCLGLTLLIPSASAAQADDPQIAQVKTVSGQVVILRDGASREAKSGDALFEKDTIKTAAGGSIGITFNDNSVMSAGPNTELALEEYRFDSSDFTGSMLADMRKGTLSVVSGDIARTSPDAMKVKTSTAILGVRGTRFVIEARGK